MDEHLKKSFWQTIKTVSRRQFLKLCGAGLGVMFPWKLRIGTTQESAQQPLIECLEIVSIRPNRPHLVAPGLKTTFVVAATNRTQAFLSINLVCKSISGEEWIGGMVEADELFQPTGRLVNFIAVDLEPEETKHFFVTAQAGAALPDDTAGSIVVQAFLEETYVDKVLLQCKVCAKTNIYFFACDGLNRDYIKLDRRGQWDDVQTDPLMPNVRRFEGDAAVLTNATCQLPSLTDPNHVSILTGSWPGTTGVYSVKEHYYGLDGDGNPIKKKGSNDILRWGSSGEPVLSVFDVAKDPALGGHPDAFSAMITGKSWIWKYFEDEANTVDILAAGNRLPYYLSPPETYVMGDPPSDENAGEDRDGINVKPVEEFHMWHDPDWGTWGDSPSSCPDDRWIVESALKIMSAEDPNVFYVLAAAVDNIGHHAGAADNPEDWFPGADIEVLWDDVNVYNPRANREPVLDTVREADVCFGTFIDALKTRGSYDNSAVVFMADHAMRTYLSDVLNQYQVCLDTGIPEEAFEWASCRGEFMMFFLSDPSYASEVERALQNYAIYHPVLKKEVHPFAILNQAEMATGRDDVLGVVARSRTPKRAELYSEWCIDHPVDDNSKPRWPDLIGFTMAGYQSVNTFGMNPPVGGHGGFGVVENIPLIIRAPGVDTGLYSNPACLVDIAPTLYQLLGWEVPTNVDGRVLSEILGPV